MSQVTFSVIVPVYNVENYLRQCVDSILAQKNCDLEVILVDDGSTDASGEICDEYAEKDARVCVIHKENGGLSDARNVGIKLTKNEYLLFVDSDDYIVKDSLQNIQDLILRNNRPDVVFLRCDKIYRDGRTVPMGNGVTSEIDGLQGNDLYKYIASLPKYPASAWSKAYKRELFSQGELFFVKGIYSEDLEWSVRVFLNSSSAAWCSSEYYKYRVSRDGSITNKCSEKNITDILATLEKWIAKAQEMENKAEKMMVKSLMEYVFRFTILWSNHIPRSKYTSYKQRVEKCAWVLGERKDSVSRLIRISYNLLGLKTTGKLLRIYLALRDK